MIILGSNVSICLSLSNGNVKNPDAYLDEQDLKDIAESQESIRQGRVYTSEEARVMLGLQ